MASCSTRLTPYLCQLTVVQSCSAEGSSQGNAIARARGSLVGFAPKTKERVWVSLAHFTAIKGQLRGCGYATRIAACMTEAIETMKRHVEQKPVFSSI